MCESERMLLEHDLPRAHLVMDDFFSPAALETIFRELPSFEETMKPGLVRDVGHDGQSVFFAHRRRKNRAVWIHEPSKTVRLFRERLWAPDLIATFEQAREPLFQVIPNCSAPHLQVSSYMTGDHYDFHEDEGAGVNLTAIVFLAASPKKVHGGHLVLAYDGEEHAIPFRNNRLVVFPSKTMHRVTRVRVDSETVRDARISLQCWLTYGKAEPSTRKTKRAPEADRPTFLLAEEPILAAAQALLAPGEQSAEDLYWGAFYLSRILSQNLRAVVASQQGITLGKIRIRRGEDLEVYARGKRGDEKLRIGFVLRGPETDPSEALSLFVAKRGKRKKRLLPPGVDEETADAILGRLLG